ncbi:unnamed protein product [Lathyrus sativus]|nr:unnamed protein product [Lathyrus sativus]
MFRSKWGNEKYTCKKTLGCRRMKLQMVLPLPFLPTYVVVTSFEAVPCSVTIELYHRVRFWYSFDFPKPLCLFLVPARQTRVAISATSNE